eukprot:c20993_g1_i1.p1 GENE.c20993_g1_i1~~c20993_g1_i1.p1  ORF type:complete len:517 (+),score=63.54 c20993_g1_i1:25-1551(+)
MTATVILLGLLGITNAVPLASTGNRGGEPSPSPIPIPGEGGSVAVKLRVGANSTNLSPNPQNTTLVEKRAKIICDPSKLQEIAKVFSMDADLASMENEYLGMIESEINLFVDHPSPSCFNSVAAHYTLLDVEDEECHAKILQAHCDLVKALETTGIYNDSEIVHPASTVHPLCNMTALRAKSSKGNVNDFLHCSIEGMIPEHDVVEYCNLTPNPPATVPPLAFAIMVHKKPRQVARLVARIVAEGNAFVAIHVHSSQISVAEVTTEILRTICPANGTACKLPHNIRVFSEVSVAWASISVHDALVATIRQLLDMSTEWRHVINLSESDYPLQPIRAIAKFLAVYGADVNFLDIHNPSTTFYDKRWRAREAGLHCHSRSYSIRLLLPPPPVQFFEGSMWTIMTREFWTEVLSHRFADIYKQVRDHAANLIIPDEVMQQTLLMASSQCLKVCNVNFRFENWQGQESPAAFVQGDLLPLAQSHSFFARKFDDSNVLDELDSLLADRLIHHA